MVGGGGGYHGGGGGGVGTRGTDPYIRNDTRSRMYINKLLKFVNFFFYLLESQARRSFR